MLKEACADVSVSVRIGRVPKGYCGDCLRMKDHFRIRIKKGMTLQETMDTLVHEFAHAEAYIEYENGVKHGPVFGVAYAKFYNVYERFTEAH
jgi:hypothetical protein